MIKTLLVQRLLAPPTSELHAKIDQAFGGGMLKLSPEAWKVLQRIFSFDYMGAAEYDCDGRTVDGEGLDRDALHWKGPRR